MESETKRFTIDLTVDQHACVKMIAAQDGVTMKDVVTDALIKTIQSRQAIEREDKFNKAMNKVLTEHDEMFKRLADK